MTDADKTAAQESLPWWRQKEPVQKVGYVLSAVWMAGIVVVTKGDTRHFLFNFIFIVPLAGWIIGLGIAAFLRRLEKNRKIPEKKSDL